MSQEEVQYCPICRKNVLEPAQILCTSCKSDNPYNLLGGYSPTKKIHDELHKIGQYKDEISVLEKKLRSAGIIIVILSVGIAALAVLHVFF
ncbi:MAG: hypothetical protein JKY52_07990 [Flavobacteriales bacterium]|nr:hypothetical protein [Flavobacteriales bacterium]